MKPFYLGVGITVRHLTILNNSALRLPFLSGIFADRSLAGTSDVQRQSAKIPVFAFAFLQVMKSSIKALVLTAAFSLPLALFGGRLQPVLHDTFVDGERNRQALPESAAWFTSAAAPTATVVDSGLRQDLRAPTMLVTYLTASGDTLSLEPGQLLRAIVTFSLENRQDQGYLRIGLFDTSARPRLSHDGSGLASPAFVGARGYILNIEGLDEGAAAQIRRRQPENPSQALMSTTRAYWAASESAATLNQSLRSGVSYTAMLEITRLDEASVIIKSSLVGPDGVVLETQPHIDSSVTTTHAFDTFGIISSSNNGDAIVIHSLAVGVSEGVAVAAGAPAEAIEAPVPAATQTPQQHQPTSGKGVAELEPIDLSTIPLDAFSDEDLAVGWSNPFPMPYYLAHFATLANSVLMDGPERGWINRRVWRSAREFNIRDQRPQEAILNLAWFYVNERPWNSFRGSEALRLRLEAGLDWYVSAIGEEGLLAPVDGQHVGLRLANTMFFTKFMGEILVLLADAPEFDRDLYERMMDAQRSALYYIFNSDLAFVQGRQFSNQYGNVFGGLYAYLSLREDDELRTLANRVIPEVVPHFQSPVGFLYENHSVDWGYTTGTHHSNTHMAWEYVDRAGMDSDWLQKETNLWGEWLSYNAVPEPDFSYFTLNRALESRQSMEGFDQLYAPFAKQVPVFRAYLPNTFELEQQQARQRQTVAETYPSVEPLRSAFTSFGPYAFLHRNHFRWNPSPSEQQAAREQLPMLKREHFIHQRVDPRWPLEVTFIRRSGYYAAFNVGQARSGVQTFGLGLLWHPKTGAVLQSQTRMHEAAWGVRIDNPRVEESSLPEVRYFLNGEPWQPRSGNQDLPQGELEIHYALPDGGEKFLRFEDQRILVVVNPGGSFVEQIPVLLPRGETVAIDGETLRVPQADGSALLVRGEGTVSVDVRETDRWIGDKQVVAIYLNGQRRFAYTLQVI